MNGFICEMCGSTEIVKKDGNFVCEQCGMKYSLDEVKRMVGEASAKEERYEESAADTNNDVSKEDVTATEEIPNADRSTGATEETAETGSGKKGKLRIVIILIIIALIIIGFVCVKFAVPASKYSNAVDLMNAGKYTDAYELFNELGDYRDSKSQKAIALECIKKEQLKNCKTGDVIFVGNCYWIVLDRKELSSGESRIFLVSKDCVAEGNFGGNINNPTWEDSSVRKWLNDTYIKEFSAREKGQIMTTEVVNPGNMKFGTPGSDTTYDKLFLLSIEEVEDFLLSSDTRTANYEGEDVWWWLRSPGKKSRLVSYIWSKGDINDTGLQAETIYTMGIRPAMIMTVGGNGSSDKIAKISDFSKSSGERNTVNYKSLYSDTLAQLQNETSSGEYIYAEYVLWDINGDAVPELIAHIGTCEADAEFRVYRCDRGEVDLAGTLPGGHSYLAGLDYEKALLLVSGMMGYEEIDKVTMKLVKVQTEILIERELGPEEDYAPFVSIEMQPIAYSSKLSWDGNEKSGNDKILSAIPY